MLLKRHGVAPKPSIYSTFDTGYQTPKPLNRAVGNFDEASWRDQCAWRMANSKMTNCIIYLNFFLVTQPNSIRLKKRAPFGRTALFSGSRTLESLAALPPRTDGRYRIHICLVPACPRITISENVSQKNSIIDQEAFKAVFPKHRPFRTSRQRTFTPNRASEPRSQSMQPLRRQFLFSSVKEKFHTDQRFAL